MTALRVIAFLGGLMFVVGKATDWYLRKKGIGPENRPIDKAIFLMIVGGLFVYLAFAATSILVDVLS